jgi:glycosyltransferase involved in cell wall biosynthesis
MRIAFVTFEYPPRLFGGAGVYAENLVSNLAKLGHELEVYVPNLNQSKEEHPMPGVSINRIGIARDWFPGWISFCLKVTKKIEMSKAEKKVDVVHINGIGFFAFRDRVKGPAYVSTGHHLSGETASKARLRLIDRLLDINGENGFLIPLVERYGARFPDRYIAVSQETKNSLISLYQVPESFVQVIWNGVDSRGAPKGTQDREELRASLGLSPGALLVFVGRVDDPRKDLITVIRALAQVPKNLRPGLVVVGSGQTTKAKNLAKDLGVLESLSFRGRVSPEELWKTYLVADACVCASKQEGFGLTIIEALCAGCKVITTEVGVVPEIRNRIEAVVDVASPNAMEFAITDMMRKPGKSSKVEVLVPYEYTWGRSAKQTLSVYEKAIEIRGKRYL